jgi:NADH:ubiquinone oxidoreductase subunit 6 (subunit J)
MLARQTGSSIYDRRFRNPLLSISLGGLLLAVLVHAIGQDAPGADVAQAVAAEVSAEGGGEAAAQVDTVSLLGRSLYAEHLWSVEIAGVLLLVATFGTIVIALDTRDNVA